jgi:hypothetical protein
MELDVSFLGTEGGAPSDNPTAQPSVTESATPPPTLTPEPVADPPVLTEPVADPAPALESQPGESPALDDEPLDEEALQKLLADNPNSPKWFRDQLKKVAGYTGKLKAEKTELQSQFESFKTQYEGKESLQAADLERMRAAEEIQYKLSSYTASPEEVLTSLKEVVNPNKFAEIKNQLAWEFLETPTGEPDLENLQVIVDRFSGFKDGENRVAAKDVLNAIQAIKRGTVKPEEFHEFASDAEYEAYKRARSVESEIEAQRALAKENAEFQETQTRRAILQNVYGTIQGQFQPQVESLLSKFQLNPTENDPKVAAEFKQAVRDRIAAEVNAASMNNPSLSDVFKAIDLLSKPTGMKADQIQQEIESYTRSFPYQTALSRGMSELMQVVEKAVTAEAYRYKLMMMGYEQEVSKGQNAREVIGQPKQTEVLANYTPEQLAAMSASERRRATLMQISNQLREGGKTSRYGG